MQIWPRHSLVVGEVRLFRSDIDITIWLESSITPINAIKFRNFLRFLKRWTNPALGEANVYSRPDIEFITSVINPYELRRDPFLFRKIQRMKHLAVFEPETDLDSLVFLLRMLVADSTGLTTHFLSQKRKWKTYLRLTNRTDVSLDSLEDLIRSILIKTPWDEAAKRELLEFLLLVLMDKTSFINSKRLDVYESYLKFSWMLFPHLSPYHDCAVPQMTGFELALLAKQIDWECAGMLTQRYFYEDPLEIPSHIKRLLQRIDHLQDVNKGFRLESLKAKLQKVLNVLENYYNIR